MVTFIKRAIIYARRSIEDKKSSMSIEHQTQICVDKAKSLGFEIAEIIIEERSAFQFKMKDRPELQKLIHLIHDTNIHGVICWQKSRLVRDMTEELILTQLFKEANIEVHFADSTEPPMIKDDHTERLIGVITAWRDEGEALKTGQRVKDHLRSRSKAGIYVGGYYTGYVWNKHTRKMEQIPGEIDIVRDIYDMYLYQGFSTRQIAHILNENGYKTKKGKKFYPYTVVGILQSKIYCGYYRWGFTENVRHGKPKPSEGIEVKVDWIEPIITLDEWKTVQDTMISRSGKKRGIPNHTIPKSSFLLTDKIICGECSGKMHGRNGTSDYTKKDGSVTISEHYRYICNSTQPHTGPKRVDSKMIDKLVLDALGKLANSLDKEEIFKKAQGNLERIKGSKYQERKHIRKKIDETNQSIENLIIHVERTRDFDLITMYESRIKDKRAELSILSKQLMGIDQELTKIDITKEDISRFFDYLKSVGNHQETTQERKRMYIESLVNKVIILRDSMTVHMKWDILDTESSLDIDSIVVNYKTGKLALG